jgi:undecaprenyl-diphosphatase
MFENIDLAILRFFNGSLINPAFDIFFKTISENWFLLSILAIMLGVIIWKDRRRGWVIAIAAIVGLALADIISADVLKKLFCRPRPCQTFPDLRTIVGCGGKFGFPSNHAANSVVIAFILTRFYKRLNTFLWTLAVLVCISRMYLGKHYPSDLIGGAVLGIIVGACLVILVKKIYKPLRIDEINTKDSPINK